MAIHIEYETELSLGIDAEPVSLCSGSECDFNG